MRDFNLADLTGWNGPKGCHGMGEVCYGSVLFWYVGWGRFWSMLWMVL
jgi:hypothetical protein